MPDTCFTRLYQPRDAPAARAPRLALGVSRRGRRPPPSARWAWSGIGAVKVKMLPFDNKSEFQVILNMPEGQHAGADGRASPARWPPRCAPNPRCATTRSTRAPPRPSISTAWCATISCAAAPTSRTSRSTCCPRANAARRAMTSPGACARGSPRSPRKYGAAVAVAEVPPGPAGAADAGGGGLRPDEAARLKLATRVREIFRSTPGVVDVDWYVEAEQPKTDPPRRPGQGGAARHHGGRHRPHGADGGAGLPGHAAARAQRTRGRQRRAGAAARAARPARGSAGAARALGDESRRRRWCRCANSSRVERTVGERNIYHKNLQNVTYVTGDVAGRDRKPGLCHPADEPGPGAARRPRFRRHAAPTSRSTTPRCPPDDREPAMKWDGEWQVTIEVFRDLGLAFGAVLILIYMLMVGWFKNYATPLIVMTVIPFSLVGILPAHCGAGGLLHRHLDDRLHGRRRHRRAQFDHPRRLHRAAARPRPLPARRLHRVGRRPLPAR